jgi:hypothetical protein
MKDELVITEGLSEDSNKLATENATENVNGKRVTKDPESS